VIKILKLIAIILIAIFFIWLFGFVLGFILHTAFIDPDAEIKYSMYRYSFSRPFPGYYLSGLLLFSPFFLIVYIVMMKFKSNVVMQKYITIFNIAIYFLYGVLVFGGQFWHLPKLLKGNFQGWLTGEHADLYFSISSLLAVLLFTRLLKQNLKLDQDSKKH
jgi:hypothetical protein